MYGYRGELVEAVSSALGEKYTSKNGLEGKENGEFYRDGKIIFQQARHGEVTRRIFEGMGCRKLVFTDYLHPDTGIYELFRQREDIIYYGNEEECIKWLNFFLEHDEERERIANNGYKKVVLYHTAMKRAKEIIELSTILLNEKK
jgi:spore maturation protein CgeB